MNSKYWLKIKDNNNFNKYLLLQLLLSLRSVLHYKEMPYVTIDTDIIDIRFKEDQFKNKKSVVLFTYHLYRNSTDPIYKILLQYYNYFSNTSNIYICFN